jgi:ABC-type cobalamin transport system ATPase subunit
LCLRFRAGAQEILRLVGRKNGCGKSKRIAAEKGKKIGGQSVVRVVKKVGVKN